MTNNQYAYMTVLSTDSYIPGVIKLYKSLKATNTVYQFICVCSRNIAKTSIESLNKRGIKCIKLDVCAVDNIALLENDTSFSHWKYTYDKLLLFGLTDYKKIVYLDSDMMILENIDDLFNCKPFSAVPAGYLINNKWTRLNSGLLVIEPDKEVMNIMLRFIPTVYQKRKDQGFATGDQDIINEYIPDWYKNKDLVLSESYNIMFKYIDIYKRKFGFRYCNTDNYKSIKVVHFIGKNKPWMESLTIQLCKVLKYILTRNYGQKAYIKYIIS